MHIEQERQSHIIQGVTKLKSMAVETVSPDPAKLHASLDVGFDHLKGEVEFSF